MCAGLLLIYDIWKTEDEVGCNQGLRRIEENGMESVSLVDWPANAFATQSPLLTRLPELQWSVLLYSCRRLMPEPALLCYQCFFSVPVWGACLEGKADASVQDPSFLFPSKRLL